MKKNHTWFIIFSIFVIFISACEANISTSSSSGDDAVLSSALSEVKSITYKTINRSIVLKWTAPTLNASHKKKDGTQLTTADVSYKVFIVEKGAKDRTVANIVALDKAPVKVRKGITTTNINNRKLDTTYEVVVQAVNATDVKKVSKGMKAEVTVLNTNFATAPAEARSVTAGSTTDTSTTISWQVPDLTSSHKKANGQALTAADVSYKVYWIAKGKNARTIAEIKKADSNPLAVAKGTTNASINYLDRNTTYEIVVQAVNSTDITKVSTGKRIEVATLANNQATAPAEARSVTAGSTTDTSTTISWQVPVLTSSHKKANGQRLTTSDVSYKVYRVVKGSNARTIAQIKAADRTPIAVGTTSTNITITITNLTGGTTYEIVVQAVNATDSTKVSTGVQIEVVTTNLATAPAESSSVTGSPTKTSIMLSWTAPNLTSSHKKANGQRLTTSDVSYKVYQVAKGKKSRTIAEIKAADRTPIAVGTTSTTITNLTLYTTYEIVVQAINATDTTKASTGIRKEVTTLSLATPPPYLWIVSPTAYSTYISLNWFIPSDNDLTSSHKKADGTQLTGADVFYKIYRVAKGSNARTIAQIIEADTNPLVVMGTGGTNTPAGIIIEADIKNLTPGTTYEMVIQTVNATDPRVASTGERTPEATTISAATPPDDPSSNSIKGSSTKTSIMLSWQAPTLTSSNKKADGMQLTAADVSYKVYHVAKGSKARTIAQIKAADRTPIAVAKGRTSTTITNLTGGTIYEIVVQAVNATDPTKISTGTRVEVIHLSLATSPNDPSPNSIKGSPTKTSIMVSWQAPTFTSSNKKVDGTQLTAADVSYKVYRIVKGKYPKSILQVKIGDKNPLVVAKGTTSINITNLKPNTTYAIVIIAVNATDPTRISGGVYGELTTHE